MKVVYSAIISILILLPNAFCQVLNQPSLAASSENISANHNKVNWKTNPFDRKKFIENHGQFDTILKNSSKVFYGASFGDVTAYFTSTGLTYRYQEPIGKKTDEKQGKEDEGQKYSKKRKVHILSVEWEGSSPNAKIEASEKQTDYYVYSTGPASSVQASLYKKITYRNLYPGIDVEYIFPGEKEGLKYSVIVHPGADVSKIKLKYSGAKNITKNKEGDLIIKTDIGDFVEHAPVSFYQGEINSPIISTNTINNNVESFHFPASYNTSKVLVIDPWITSPFGGTRDGWDIDYDYNGNVYSGSSYGLVKLNSAGVLLWTYLHTSLYCDFTVDRATGNSFIVGIGGGTSGSVEKISTAGGLMGSYFSPAPINGSVREFWRAVWNPCTNQIVIGGGGTGGTAGRYQGAIITTNLTGFNYLNVVGAPSSSRDMVGVAVDPIGTTCYMACCFRSNYNVLVKLPLPTLTPTTFNVPDGYLFSEQQHNRYAGTFQNGMNIMTAGNNGVYMWDGYTLSKFNKTTGALIANNIILPTVFAGGVSPSVKTFWSGIDVDACEKLYVGYQTTIRVFNTNLVQTSVINLPSNLDTVHDLAIGLKGKTLYACGEKFVTSIDVLGQSTDSIAKSRTQATCTCNGTATASLFVQCGNPVAAGVTYSWSNGQTTQTATGLCAGVHNVTLTYNCKPYPDTVRITSPSGLSITNSQSNVLCFGGNTGSSTANVTGGAAPYTYNWSPSGGTNATANNLSAGTYTVSITDANGCKIISIVSIAAPNPPITGSSSINNSCTTTGSATVFVGNSTPYSYTWSNGASGRTTNGLLAGNYSVTVTDGNNCTQTKAFTITGTNPVSAAFSQSQTNVCAGTNVIFTHTGTTGTHAWSIAPGGVSGTTTNFSYTFLSAGTYTISHTVTNAGCTATVTRNVFVTNCSGPTAIATGSSVCPGSCATVTSSGTGGTSPYTYSWNTGATSQNINPCPASTTTYTVTIRDAGGTTSTSTAVVTIYSAVTASTSPSNISCSGGTNGSALANSGGGTAPYTYSWSNSQTTQIATGLSQGNYTVTITDNRGCSNFSTATITSPQPLTGQFVKGTGNCSGCGCKEWLMVNASGGTSPYTYSWPGGNTNRYSNQLCPGNYVINITDKNGCSVNANLNTP